MKNKVKAKKLIELGATIMILVAITCTVYFIFFTGPSIYKQYEKEDKTVGVVKNYEKENDDFYISIFYPTYKIDALDKQIQKYYQESIKEEKAAKSKNTLYMDYSSNKTLDQYIDVQLKFKRFDEEDKEINNKTKIFTFDTKTNQTLKIEDVFRGKYIELLKQKGAGEIDPKSTSIRIDDKSIHVYFDLQDASKKVTIPFAENQNYIALNNQTVNTQMPKETIVVRAPQQIDPNKPMVAITFDDGPHPINTKRVLDIFDKYDGRATFFMLGKLVESHPDVVKDVYQRGFELANHSWDHANLPKQTMDKVTSEIYDTQNAIYKITGKEPSLFRPPYGAFNPAIKAESLAGNTSIMLWTGDTQDWKTKNAELVKNAVLRDAHDGAVILLHDIHGSSVEGIEKALPILKEQGYQFVTIDTLKQYRQVKEW